MRCVLLALLTGVGVIGATNVATAEACSRPPTVSVTKWNTMSAQAQEATCRPTATPAVGEAPWINQQDPKPANWNKLSASEQAYWRTYGTLPARLATPPMRTNPSIPAATSTRCGRACGELWTPEDFAASRR